MRNFFENNMATVAQAKEAGFFYCSTGDPLWNNVLPSSQREKRVSRLNRTGNNTTGWARRLTALLITACLVMAMALPVYAEVDLLPDAPDEVELLEDEPETASGEDTALPEQNAATPVPDAATPEPEQSAGPEQPAPTETPEPTAEPAPTPEPTATATATPTPTVTPTATPEPTEQPQKMYAARSVDNVQAVSASANTYTLYFAVPRGWSDCTVVKIHAVDGQNQNDDRIYFLEMHEVDETKDRRKIYSVVLNKDNHYKNGGVNGLEFCGYKGNANAIVNENPEYTVTIAKVGFQIQNPPWITFNPDDSNHYNNDGSCHDGYIGGDYYDGENGEGWHPEKWETYTVGHKHFAGKAMAFENKTSETLTNVKAWFYEPTEKTRELELIGEPKSLNSAGLESGIASGTTATFEIPNDFCSFVRFTAGNDDTVISEYYNFYNEEVTGEKQKSFQYSEGQCYCYMYNGNDDATWGCPGATRIYYDATFSKMSLNGDTGDFSIPKANNSAATIYYRIKGGNGTSVSGTLVKDGTNENLYYVDIPQGYNSIIFSGDAINDDNATRGNGVSTAWLPIPTDGNNCFYADTNDDAVYTNGQRGGYWAPKGTLRDAETWKEPKTKVVDIASATFTEEADTKYVTSTLYDYYTDYELNGKNRDSYDQSSPAVSYRNWVPFREFDQALSDYYQVAKAEYPLYTGHFQPSYSDYGYKFDAISDALNLWGLNSVFKNENRFMAINNSTINEAGNGTRFYYAYQGLVENTTSNGKATGELLLKDTTKAEPHFDEAFLSGTNTKNAKLGNVYNNVAFPFTKRQIFNEDQGVDYWYFDSQDTTLYLKQDSKQDQYFLKSSTDVQEREKSRNLESNSTSKTITKNNETVSSYGYFPFNETATSGVASTYNYGFGTKLQMDFTLTDDGKVETSKVVGGKKEKTSIKFFFSGDDDVWVFIDGKLALDVGGAHGKVSGLLEFGATNDGKNSVTAYVSKVKKGGTSENDQDGNPVKTVTYNGESISFSAQNTNLEPLDKGKKHTLTMYYMERGMWESNMAVAFNFPDNNELQVQKEVDLSKVDTDFKNCFKNQKIFNFTIQNQATHYGEKKAADPDTNGTPPKEVDLTKDVNSIAPATKSTEGDYIFELADNPGPDSGTNTKQVLHWYARYQDTEPVSDNRDKRYGILTLNQAINIKDERFLTFEVYVDSKDGDNLSLNNLYLELLDEQKPIPGQKGSLGTSGINGATYGSVDVKTDKWVTVKLDLNKMKEQGGFNGNVTTIRVGDNYSRHIYFRNFTFIPKAKPSTMSGFTTDQKDIPDYGSATSGHLQNAENAQYTSTKDKDTQLVDGNGRFVLEDGETVTFSDQFRRGSYISLKEKLNKNLYDTTWTVYENGRVVTSTNPDDTTKVNTVTFGENRSLEKQSKPPKGPDDGRTEKMGTEEEQKGNQYDGNKPSADTIVFRSYKDPDETSSTLTKLKVKYVNKVKTGGLKIQKLAADGENLTGTYKFKVTFNDVGGEGLEKEPIIKYVEIKMGENADNTGTITGIPVGTRYTIEEVKPEDDSRLQSVTVPTDCHSAHVIKNNTMVEGVIEQGEDPSITAIFTNTQRTLINIEFDKLWKDANGTDNLSTANQPDEIYIQLQRRLANSAEDAPWDVVDYPTSGSKYVTVHHKDSGWTSTFSGLDQYQINTDDSHTNYVYRIVEGTVDDEGNFAEVKPNETITIKGNTYVVTAKAEAKISDGDSTKKTEATVTADGTITGGSGKIELINKLQNPKFVLDIIKKDAEPNNENKDVFLKDVEFKLEKLKAETTEGEPQVDTTYKFSNGNTGSITAITNGSGEITDVFKDLEPGTYRLTETKAHKGYNLLAQPIVIKFTQDGKCYIDGVEVKKEDKTFSQGPNNTYTMTLTVLNRKTPELPHTGADAPSLWLLIGLPLAVAGLLIFTFRYNRKGGRRH